MNPRPLKELLQILLDEVERNGVESGLCAKIRMLYAKNKINKYERFCLYEFIEQFLDGIFKTFLFPKGESQPRIEFLKNEIEKLT